MTSANAMNMPCEAVFLCNSKGQSAILNIGQAELLEEIIRDISTKWDESFSVVGAYCMDGIQAQKIVIEGTVSLAVELGESYLAGDNILSAICKRTNGKILFNGRIAEVSQNTGKFLEGKITIKNGNQTGIVDYKNEFMRFSLNGQVMINTPDIISILNAKTYQNIYSERLQENIESEVVVLTFKAADIWYTERGLQLLGYPFSN